MVKEQYSQSDFQTNKYQYKIYNYGVVVEEGSTNKKSDLYPIFKKYVLTVLLEYGLMVGN